MRGFPFVLKIVLLCAAAVYCTPAVGQSSVDQALKNLQRQKWQRSHDLLTKSLAKDSLNVTAKYVLAQYFFSEDNPAFHLDSAYRYANGSLSDFQNTSLKQRERLKKFPLDSLLLIDLRRRIDTAAFLVTKMHQTEKAWTDFIEHFSYFNSMHVALGLRDSVAFANAVQENTYQSFQNFFQRYPQAKEASAARDLYEKLLLEDRTADQTLASFEAFLSDYPESPYRAKVEQTIFEYKTASGEPETFIDFIQSNPASPFVRMAKNILFHLIPLAARDKQWPVEFSSDSLANVLQLEQGYWVRILKKKTFAFMDQDGNEISLAAADSLDQVQQCGNIDGDFVVLPDKIITKSGACIWKGKINDVEDLGSGFLLIGGESCASVIHKTGFKIGDDCIDDARMLNNKFIATKENNHWSIWTLTGRLLIGNKEEIFCARDVIGLKEGGKTKLLTAAKLAALPFQSDPGDTVAYEEVKSWNNDLIFVRNGTCSGLFSQSLQNFVTQKDQIITPAFFGVIAATGEGTCFYNTNGQTSMMFQEVIVRDPWIAVKDSLWRFLDPKTMGHFGNAYDTVIMYGPFAAGFRQDSTYILFDQNNFQKNLRPSEIEFVPGKDGSAFLMVTHGDRKIIYDRKGQKLFVTSFDKIQHAGNDLFIVVNKNEKRGMIGKNAKLLLPAEYDAIVPMSNGIFSLLKGGKFGLYDVVKKKKIPPAYHKNLTLYNHETLVAYKNGSYGFLKWDSKPLSKFEFAEIQFWNDTTALVKKNAHWMLYEITTNKVVLDEIKDLTWIRNSSTEKLAIVHQQASYGVVHNQNGTIIPISYNDIVNVGSDELPLYFTEKQVEEANIFVVLYYNSKGELLRTAVYDQDDYDKVYCNN
jgi:hypothetical protein